MIFHIKYDFQYSYLRKINVRMTMTTVKIMTATTGTAIKGVIGPPVTAVSEKIILLLILLLYIDICI